MPGFREPEFCRLAANLIINELLPRLEKAGIEINSSPVSPGDLSFLTDLKLKGVISTREIRQVLDTVFEKKSA